MNNLVPTIRLILLQLCFSSRSILTLDPNTDVHGSEMTPIQHITSNDKFLENY